MTVKLSDWIFFCHILWSHITYGTPWSGFMWLQYVSRGRIYKKNVMNLWNKVNNVLFLLKVVYFFSNSVFSTPNILRKSCYKKLIAWLCTRITVCFSASRQSKWTKDFTRANIHVVVFWVMTPCFLVGGYYHSGEKFCHLLQCCRYSEKESFRLL